MTDNGGFEDSKIATCWHCREDKQKFHLATWNVECKSREGGLGLKLVRLMNSTNLVKWLWRLVGRLMEMDCHGKLWNLKKWIGSLCSQPLALWYLEALLVSQGRRFIKYYILYW